ENGGVGVVGVDIGHQRGVEREMAVVVAERQPPVLEARQVGRIFVNGIVAVGHRGALSRERARARPEPEQVRSGRMRLGAYEQCQNCRCESSNSVTGPQLTSSTSIMARKRPVSTRKPALRNLATNFSYSACAASGPSACVKDGRLPFRQSPYNVN